MLLTKEIRQHEAVGISAGRDTGDGHAVRAMPRLFSEPAVSGVSVRISENKDFLVIAVEVRKSMVVPGNMTGIRSLTGSGSLMGRTFMGE